MKALIASSALLMVGANTAIAGPYVVVENNGGYTGSDFTGSVTDFHIGYEESGLYGEIGPSVFTPDNGEAETLLTGKVGGSFPVNEKLVAYGELAVTFDEVNSYGTKVGVKYSF